MAFVNRLWLAYRRPACKGDLHPPCKGTVLMLRIVKFVIGLRPPNTRCVPSMVFSSYCIGGGTGGGAHAPQKIEKFDVKLLINHA